MKLFLLTLLSFLMCNNIKCDLLDGEFYVYLLDNILSPTERKMEALMLIRTRTIISNAAYEAIAPYSDNLVSIYSTIPRRPLHERTIRNKNIAIAFAVFRAAERLNEPTLSNLTNLYNQLKLDIYDQSLSLLSPIGIGNFAAKIVLDSRQNDGMNQLGNENDKRYNLKPYDDYTNYVPKNNAYKLSFPGSWQPNIDQGKGGVFTIQEHMCAQYGRVKPYCLKDIHRYSCPIPLKSNPLNIMKYKEQVDEILDESRRLDDYKKMVAEHFDNKIVSLSRLLFFFKDKYNLKQDDMIPLDFFSHVALFDAGIVIWKEKIKHDAVRPFSAVKYLYENENIVAWGGPGKGTVNDIKGKEWRSYIPTAPHTEYPSATSCLCAAMLSFLKKYFNTDKFGYSIRIQKGSSVIEPNVTPVVDITLGPYTAFNDYINACGYSRLLGGVHFSSSIDEGIKLGNPIGEIVHKFAMEHINGMVQSDCQN